MTSNFNPSAASSHVWRPAAAVHISRYTTSPPHTPSLGPCDSGAARCRRPPSLSPFLPSPGLASQRCHVSVPASLSPNPAASDPCAGRPTPLSVDNAKLLHCALPPPLQYPSAHPSLCTPNAPIPSVIGHRCSSLRCFCDVRRSHQPAEKNNPGMCMAGVKSSPLASNCFAT